MFHFTPHALWLGNSGSTRDPRTIFASGITTVVELAMEEPPARLAREMCQLRFPLSDGGGNPRSLLALTLRTVAALLRTETPTLLCCSMGMSRTPATAAFALELATGVPATQILQEIRARTVCDVSPALWAEMMDAMAAARS